MQKNRFILFLCVCLALTGCTLPRRAAPDATATATTAPVPSALPSATATITPLPSPTTTPTEVPTPTLTPTPVLLVGPDMPLPKGLAPITPDNAGEVSGLAEWRETAVADLAWTPDGVNLAVATPYDIRLYDPLTRRNMRTLYPARTGVVDIAFSPKGNWLAAAEREGSYKDGFASGVELWHGPDWRPLGLLYGAPRGLNNLAFSPDGFFLAAVFSSPNSYENSIEFFNTLSWAISDTLQTGTALNVVFAPDGTILAYTPDRYAINVWDTQNDEPLYQIHTSFTGAVNSLAFSPDSGILASGHYDGMVRLWDMRTGELALEFDSGAVVQSLTFSPDGRLLATGGSFENSLVQLWSAGSGTLLRQLDGQGGGIVGLAFSPDGQMLASAAYDGLVRLWGVRPQE